MGPQGAVKIIFREEIARAKDPEQANGRARDRVRGALRQSRTSPPSAATSTTVIDPAQHPAGADRSARARSRPSAWRGQLANTATSRCDHRTHRAAAFCRRGGCDPRSARGDRRRAPGRLASRPLHGPRGGRATCQSPATWTAVAARAGEDGAASNRSTPVFKHDPRRQSRRDRAARHPCVPRTWHRRRRRLLGCGSRRAARSRGRRGDPPRANATVAIVSQRRARLEVAQLGGCDAIHPGYGFLAENAAFARKTAEKGLTFIGPSPTAMERMGDKLSARAVAIQTGVPVVPGTTSAAGSVKSVLDAAASFGYPIAIKASAGGGGKGLKVASSAAEVESAVSLASKEAAAYFADGTVYVERYLPQPKARGSASARRSARRSGAFRRTRLLDATAAPEARRRDAGFDLGAACASACTKRRSRSCARSTTTALARSNASSRTTPSTSWR